MRIFTTFSTRAFASGSNHIYRTRSPRSLLSISLLATSSRAARLSLLAIVVSIALAACSGIVPDRRPAADVRKGTDVTQALEAVPGVVLAEVRSGPDGLPGQNEMNADIVVQPGYTPAVAELLDYVLRQLWSQNETPITTNVSIKLLTGTATESTTIDLIPALTTLGITAYNRDPTTVDSLGYELGIAELTTHYGAWPGPVPELPVALSAPSAAPPP